MDPAAAQAAADATSTLVKSTLGAIAVLAFAVAIWAIREMRQAFKDRVADVQAGNVRQEASNAADRKAQEDTSKTLGEFAATLREVTKTIERLDGSIKDLARGQNDIVRDMVVARRRPMSGGYAAVTPSTPRGDPRREE